MLFAEFIGFFAFTLVFGYLLPVGQFYYWYHVRKDPRTEQQRIQVRLPTAGQVRHEILSSLSTIFVFAILATGLFQLYLAGLTAIYHRLSDYPLWYVPVSFLFCLVIHDTFFYWTHRVMHWPRVFKYVHLGHHRSATPTPWAIFAFQPLESILQFVPVALIVMYVPLHPLTLLAYLSYDTVINTAGHTGYEVIPESVARSWYFQGLNTVSHHDAHHSNTQVNFGSFFNVWDRWMGTFLDAHVHERDPEPIAAEPSQGPAWPGRDLREPAEKSLDHENPMVRLLVVDRRTDRPGVGAR